MGSEKKLSVMLTGLVSKGLSTALIARIRVGNSPKRLLNKADVFSEPLKERINEFIDLISVTFDEVTEIASGIFEQKRAKSVVTVRKAKIAPGRYVRAKV